MPDATIPMAGLEPAGRHLLLFDGECGICSWLAQRAGRLDRGGLFTILPFQDLSDADLAPWGVTREACAERLHLLLREDPRGFGDRRSGRRGLRADRAARSSRRVRRGAFAVNTFLRLCPPWGRLVAILYLIPPLLLVEVVGYGIVARHRAWISRWLGLAGCAVRPPSRT